MRPLRSKSQSCPVMPCLVYLSLFETSTSPSDVDCRYRGVLCFSTGTLRQVEGASARRVSLKGLALVG